MSASQRIVALASMLTPLRRFITHMVFIDCEHVCARCVTYLLEKYATCYAPLVSVAKRVTTTFKQQTQCSFFFLQLLHTINIFMWQYILIHIRVVMYREKKTTIFTLFIHHLPFINLWVRSIKIGLTRIIMWATGQGHVLDNTAACSTVVDYITERKITECPIRWRVKVDVCVAVWHGDPCIADLQNETRCCGTLKGGRGSNIR